MNRLAGLSGGGFGLQDPDSCCARLNRSTQPATATLRRPAHFLNKGEAESHLHKGDSPCNKVGCRKASCNVEALKLTHLRFVKSSELKMVGPLSEGDVSLIMVNSMQT